MNVITSRTPTQVGHQIHFQSEVSMLNMIQVVLYYSQWDGIQT
jgi:hypothetical protein